MAATALAPPFSPEETRRILHHLQQPAVFPHMTRGWPVLHWTAEHLSARLGDRRVRFRLGRREEAHGPQFETQCAHLDASLAQFLGWTRGQTGTGHVGPFSRFPLSEFWAYADYKYIATLFQDQPLMFEDVRWSEFGFQGRDGRESTLWVGTEGANTPCHLDSYGYNLVLQVQGRKRWSLFPPEDTAKLYPTRIPLEESSVFSRVDVLRPDRRRFPKFQGANLHRVTLQPGQVLYVPRHWWHYVESVDPVTVSVNSWIELESDDVARVSEAVTRTVVCAIKGAPSDDNTDVWLNPTEEDASPHDDNMHMLNQAVRACARRRGEEPKRGGGATKRDWQGGFSRTRGQVGEPAAFRVPFGPRLVPVRCQRDEARGETLRPHGDSSVTPGQDEARRGPHEGAAETPEPNQVSGPPTISTNQLLDCLLHPDVVARVTELLLEGHSAPHQSNLPSGLHGSQHVAWDPIQGTPEVMRASGSSTLKSSE